MSWHALFAKEHTEQLLWASIIRKCNKIRQTDYISELGSKIKTQFGKGFNYGACARLFEHQPLSRLTVVALVHKFVARACVWAYAQIKKKKKRSCLENVLSQSLHPCSIYVFLFMSVCWWEDEGGAQPVATYTGFQPAIDTNLVLANGCGNHFRLRCQLVSNRG